MTEHPPGWYEQGGERRYRDGHRWTRSTSTPRAPSPRLQVASDQALAPDAPPSAPFVPMAHGGPVTVARKEPWLSVLRSTSTSRRDTPGLIAAAHGQFSPSTHARSTGNVFHDNTLTLDTFVRQKDGESPR